MEEVYITKDNKMEDEYIKRDRLSLSGCKQNDYSTNEAANFLSNSCDSNYLSKKKKKFSNYRVSTYAKKVEEFNKLFCCHGEDIGKLIYNCSCTLQKEFLYQGKLFISTNGLFFISSIFKKESHINIKWISITNIKKSKTAKLIPNAVQICTQGNQIFLTSIKSRDKLFFIMSRLWRLAIDGFEMPAEELNQLVQNNYGKDLSLNRNDDVRFSSSEKLQNKRLKFLQRNDSFEQDENQTSNKEKHEDQQSHNQENIHLLNIPFITNCTLNDDTCESKSTEIDDKDVKASENDPSLTKIRSSSPLVKLRKNSLFPLRKSRSKSFEQVKIEVTGVDEPQNSFSKSSAGSKKTIEDENIKRSTLPSDFFASSQIESKNYLQPPQDIVANDEQSFEESGVDSETATKCCEHAHLPILVLDEKLNLAADCVFQLCFSDSQLYRNFVKSKKTFVCPCGKHKELSNLVTEEVHNMQAKSLFRIIFNNTDLWSKLLNFKKAKDVVLSPWSQDDSETKGSKVRNITYTLSLNYPFGPKHAVTTEKQILHADSTPGEFYLVDTECINNGLPYGEDFYIVNRFCISKISEDKCRLRITSQIKYRKKVWGIVRTFIEKNATSGILETFNIMGHLLKQEAERNQSTNQLQKKESSLLSRKKILRRRPLEKLVKMPQAQISSDDCQNKDSSSGEAISKITNKQTSSVLMRHIIECVEKKENKKWVFNTTFGSTVQFVTIFAIFLCLCNVFLYVKLWSLESATNRFSTQILSEKKDILRDYKTISEKDLLQLNSGVWKILKGDTAKMEQWKNVVSSIMEMMEHLAQSVSRLEQIINPSNPTS